MFIASSTDSFKADFINGLRAMLSSDSLGAFILVLANSMQDEKLHQALAKDLAKQFDFLHKQKITGPEDDVAVFSALQQRGIEQLSQWETVTKYPWELIYNPLRALRPARSAAQMVEQIQQAFDPSKFHFNKPFLRPEILCESEWRSLPMRVLYNKFPFAPWHVLIVPEPKKQQPQFLNQAIHQKMMALATEQAEIFAGFGLAFNSLGAYASVNQLHFQGFIKDTPLPIELTQWEHNGGEIAYPLHCYRYDNASDAWQMIESYHQQNQPYNLLYRKGYCYVLPRKGQGSVALPDWAQGIAWYELCGVFTLSDKNTIENLSTAQIHLQLEKLQVLHNK